MKVRAGTVDIAPGGRYTTRETDGNFTIDLDSLRDSGLHTLVIYDKDTDVPYIHYLRVNMQDGNLSTGFEAISYEEFNPPKKTGEHRYVVLLYRQLLPYEEVNLEAHRDTFNLLPFIKENYGGEIARIEFFVKSARFTKENPDPDPEPSYKSFYHPPSGYGSRYGPHHKELMLQDKALTDDQQKFCSCILKVEQKGSAKSPYAVCAKTVGTTSRQCGKHYNFDIMPDDLLKAHMSLEKLSVPIPWNRERALNIVKAHAASKR